MKILFLFIAIVEVTITDIIERHKAIVSQELFHLEKRHCYVTHTSFLGFIQLVNKILTEMMKEIVKVKQSM